MMSFDSQLEESLEFGHSWLLIDLERCVHSCYIMLSIRHPYNEDPVTLKDAFCWLKGSLSALGAG